MRNKAQAVIDWITMWTTLIPKDSWEFGKYYHEFKEGKDILEYLSPGTHDKVNNAIRIGHASFAKPDYTDREKDLVYQWKTGNSNILRHPELLNFVGRSKVKKDVTVYRAGEVPKDKVIEFSLRKDWVDNYASSENKKVTALKLHKGDSALFVPHVTDHHRVEVGVLVHPSQYESYQIKEGKSEHEFSSTQVNFPKQEASLIKKYGEQIPDEDLYIDPKDPSYGRQEDIHITVKYGIHTADPSEVREVIESSSPIKAKLGTISLFTADDYDVVKIDVDSSGLSTLNKLVSKSTKVTDTHPTYNPHVTIAYVKKGKGKTYVGDKSFVGKEVVFNELVFSGKDGKMTTIYFLGKKENKMSLANEVTNVLEEVSGLNEEEGGNALLISHGWKQGSSGQYTHPDYSGHRMRIHNMELYHEHEKYYDASGKSKQFAIKKPEKIAAYLKKFHSRNSHDPVYGRQVGFFLKKDERLAGEEVSGEDIAKAMLKKTIKKELEKKQPRSDGVASFSKAAILRLVTKKT